MTANLISTRYYLTAVFPILWIYRILGLLAFIEAFIFVLILVVGFVYVWAKGDLDWVKMNVRYGKGRYSNLKTEGELS